MNYKDVSSSLRRITDKVLTQDDLAKRIIIQKGNNYRVFDTYTIEETQGGWKVSSKTFDRTLTFSSAKIALAWCILYNSGRYQTVATMEWLDNRLVAKQSDIDILTCRLENVTPTTNSATMLARLSEDINSRQKYKKQLTKCVDSAKYIKPKGTNNELNRPNKTSRRKKRR